MKVRHRGKGSSDRKKRPQGPPSNAIRAAPTKAARFPGRRCGDTWNACDGVRKGPWTPDEDAALCAAVSVHGALTWKLISKLVGTRNPKQCHERWHQQLKPGMCKRSFSAEEDALVLAAAEKYDNRWRHISNVVFNNIRTQNTIKNRWYTLMARPGARSYKVQHERERSDRYAGGWRAPKPTTNKETARWEADEELIELIEPLELDTILQDIGGPPPPAPRAPLELDTILQDIGGPPPPAPRAPLGPLSVGPNVLPPPAKTSRMWMAIMQGSPTGIAINGNHYKNFKRCGPFDAINRALSAQRDARTCAWDGLPRHYDPFDVDGMLDMNDV